MNYNFLGSDSRPGQPTETDILFKTSNKVYYKVYPPVISYPGKTIDTSTLLRMKLAPSGFLDERLTFSLYTTSADWILKHKASSLEDNLPPTNPFDEHFYYVPRLPDNKPSSKANAKVKEKLHQVMVYPELPYYESLRYADEPEDFLNLLRCAFAVNNMYALAMWEENGTVKKQFEQIYPVWVIDEFKNVLTYKYLSTTFEALKALEIDNLKLLEARYEIFLNNIPEIKGYIRNTLTGTASCEGHASRSVSFSIGSDMQKLLENAINEEAQLMILNKDKLAADIARRTSGIPDNKDYKYTTSLLSKRKSVFSNIVPYTSTTRKSTLNTIGTGDNVIAGGDMKEDNSLFPILAASAVSAFLLTR